MVEMHESKLKLFGFPLERARACGLQAGCQILAVIDMATYEIPKSAGKFTVVVARGGHYAVWNRKSGRESISIPVRTKKQAEQIAMKLNRGEHNGKISVL